MISRLISQLGNIFESNCLINVPGLIFNHWLIQWFLKHCSGSTHQCFFTRFTSLCIRTSILQEFNVDLFWGREDPVLGIMFSIVHRVVYLYYHVQWGCASASVVRVVGSTAAQLPLMHEDQHLTSFCGVHCFFKCLLKEVALGLTKHFLSRT